MTGRGRYHLGSCPTAWYQASASMQVRLSRCFTASHAVCRVHPCAPGVKRLTPSAHLLSRVPHRVLQRPHDERGAGGCGQADVARQARHAGRLRCTLHLHACSCCANSCECEPPVRAALPRGAAAYAQAGGGGLGSSRCAVLAWAVLGELLGPAAATME